MPDVGKIKHCWEDNCVAAENEREVEKRRLFLPHQICSAPDAAASENLETVSHSVSVHQRHLIGHFPPNNSLLSSLSLNNQLTSLWYWTHICDSTFTLYPIDDATNQSQSELVKPALIFTLSIQNVFDQTPALPSPLNPSTLVELAPFILPTTGGLVKCQMPNNLNTPPG